MHMSALFCSEPSVLEEALSLQENNETLASSPLNIQENESTPKAKFNIQEKIRELMEMSSPVSPSPTKYRLLAKNAKRKVCDINNGVGHGIRRPRIKKAKEKRLNKAKQSVTRMKEVKMPPRFPTNRSPLKSGIKMKQHKLSSPGMSLLKEHQEEDVASLKFFTSRSRASATIKINDTIKLSAMNGEISMQSRTSSFQKKNIGRDIEAELEKKIAAASLQSPTTAVARLENTRQLVSVSLRPSPPKPTRFTAISPRKSTATKSPKLSPTRSSPKKKLWKNSQSLDTAHSPKYSKSTPRIFSPTSSPQSSKGSPGNKRFSQLVNRGSPKHLRDSPVLKVETPKRVVNSPVAKVQLLQKKDSPKRCSRVLINESSPVQKQKHFPFTTQSPRVVNNESLVSQCGNETSKQSSDHSNHSTASSGVIHSTKSGADNELEDLDLAFDSIDSTSEEEEILKSLLKNQTPEKTAHFPRRSPRKHMDSPKANCTGNRPKNVESPKSNENVKYFPIFEPKHQNHKCVLPSTTNNNKIANFQAKKYISSQLDKSQMIIDAGQKRFGAAFCNTCNTLFEPGNPEDEEAHAKFHVIEQSVLKYPGWKKEDQVTNLDHLGGRIIHVSPRDNLSHWRKVREALECVDQELGFSENGIQSVENTNAFLYVMQKQIVGVLIAEGIKRAYKVIQQNSRSIAPSSGSQLETSKLICCSETPQKVSFGISRIWVLGTYRRRGIASLLVDAMRANIVPYCYLTVDQFAFSDPTQSGMHFAEKYIKTTDFLVYRRE